MYLFYLLSWDLLYSYKVPGLLHFCRLLWGASSVWLPIIFLYNSIACKTRISYDLTVIEMSEYISKGIGKDLPSELLNRDNGWGKKICFNFYLLPTGQVCLIYKQHENFWPGSQPHSSKWVSEYHFYLYWLPIPFMYFSLLLFSLNEIFFLFMRQHENNCQRNVAILLEKCEKKNFRWTFLKIPLQTQK